MSGSLGSQFDGLGSSIGNLILSMLPDNTSVSSFALWGSTLFRGLEMVKMYFFLYVLACVFLSSSIPLISIEIGSQVLCDVREVTF